MAAYNRAQAKARALTRVEDRKALSAGIPDFRSWGPLPVPATPRCPRCGSKILSRADRCPICWRPLP